MDQIEASLNANAIELPPLDGTFAKAKPKLPQAENRSDIRKIIQNKIKQKRLKLDNLDLSKVKESDDEGTVNGGSRKANFQKRSHSRIKSTFENALTNHITNNLGYAKSSK